MTDNYRAIKKLIGPMLYVLLKRWDDDCGQGCFCQDIFFDKKMAWHEMQKQYKEQLHDSVADHGWDMIDKEVTEIGANGACIRVDINCGDIYEWAIIESKIAVDLKRLISLRLRLDELLRAYLQQRFTNGQHHFTSEQLSQLENITESLRNGRAFPCCHSAWSVHDMAQHRRYEKAGTIRDMLKAVEQEGKYHASRVLDM